MTNDDIVHDVITGNTPDSRASFMAGLVANGWSTRQAAELFGMSREHARNIIVGQVPQMDPDEYPKAPAK